MGVTTVYREEHHVVAEVTALQCNCCGRETKASDSDSHSYRYGFHTINLSGGYGDHFPGDMEVFEIVVCEDCLQKWVGTFVDPNVSHGGGFGQYLPYTAISSETNQEMLVERGWLYPVGTTLPGSLWNTPEMPEDYPAPGIWEHFKCNRYQVIDLAWDLHTKIPHVIYRALYGESKIWARPLPEWFEAIERGTYTGPRFRQVGGVR